MSYTLTQLMNGALLGHNRNGTNILVNSPSNNTEYICVSQTNQGENSSRPVYIIIAGELRYVCTYICTYIQHCKTRCEIQHCITLSKTPSTQ